MVFQNRSRHWWIPCGHLLEPPPDSPDRPAQSTDDHDHEHISPRSLRVSPWSGDAGSNPVGGIVDPLTLITAPFDHTTVSIVPNTEPLHLNTRPRSTDPARHARSTAARPAPGHSPARLPNPPAIPARITRPANPTDPPAPADPPDPHDPPDTGDPGVPPTRTTRPTCVPI